jgi:hypothetical protein
MKTMFTIASRRAIVMLLMFAALPVTAQSIEEKMTEHLANARVLAAKTRSPVTTQQCNADLSSWEARNVADGPKVDSPNIWYEKLSTEELLRLEAVSLSCGEKHFPLSVSEARDHKFNFIMWHGTFAMVLLFRAENILEDHGLYHKYLLEPSR